MSTGELEEALSRLFRRNLHTIKLGLDPVRGLLEALDRPQDAFLCIHIAGTNGKGSVSALAESMLRSAGLRTGLYTSPHLVRFNERIQVGGRPISDELLAGLLDDVEAAVARMRTETGERDVTFFEFTTALAFEHFRRQRVQVAVVETGMGGRLDATNVVTPLVTAITSIGFDHEKFLGDTLAKIAEEKAGIIKERRPVVVGSLPPEAMAVVTRVARHHYAPLVVAAEAVSVRRQEQSFAGQRVHVETAERGWGIVDLPLLGDHQLQNLAMAVAVVEQAARAMKLTPDERALKRGIAATAWPGRCQVLQTDPPVLLDGAHNPEAAETLARTLRQLGHKMPWAGVAGFLSDKDVPGMLRPIAPLLRNLWVVEPPSERALPAPSAIASLHGLGFTPHAAGLGQALTDAVDWARRNGGAVCIFGSLYLVGAVLAREGVLRSGRPGGTGV